MMSCRIIFAKNNRAPIEVSDFQSSLMQILLNSEMPVASSCHGEAVCGKCRLRILSGAEYLTAENDNEKFLRQKMNLPADQRISCQTFLKPVALSSQKLNSDQCLQDVVIDASYW